MALILEPLANTKFVLGGAKKLGNLMSVEDVLVSSCPGSNCEPRSLGPPFYSPDSDKQCPVSGNPV